MYKECEMYIIENTEKAKKEFHEIAWGSEDIELNEEEFNVLKNGKTLIWSDGEYSHSISLRR